MGWGQATPPHHHNNNNTPTRSPYIPTYLSTYPLSLFWVVVIVVVVIAVVVVVVVVVVVGGVRGKGGVVVEVGEEGEGGYC